MTKEITSFIALLIFSLGAHADIKLSKYAKVYKGGEGAVVTFVPLAGSTEKKALIEVAGIDTEFDGLILLYDLEDQGLTDAYTMKYDGRVSTRLRTNEGDWSRWTTLYLPDVKDGIELNYKEEASKKLDTAKFLERYKEQEKAGVQEKLAVFKRAQHTEEAKQAFMSSAAIAQADCGKKFGAEFPWASATEEQLRDYSFSSYCGEVFNQLATLCKKSEKSRASILSKIDTVSCVFGDTLNLRLDGKTLHWTTAENEPDQETFIKHYLMNEF